MGVNANQTVIKFTRPNNAGEVEIQCRLNAFRWNREAPVSEEELFCGTDRSIGSGGWSGTGSGLFSATALEAHAILDELYTHAIGGGVALPVRYGPAGDTAGQVLYSGNGWVNSYDVGA